MKLAKQILATPVHNGFQKKIPPPPLTVKVTYKFFLATKVYQCCHYKYCYLEFHMLFAIAA